MCGVMSLTNLTIARSFIRTDVMLSGSVSERWWSWRNGRPRTTNTNILFCKLLLCRYRVTISAYSSVRLGFLLRWLTVCSNRNGLIPKSVIGRAVNGIVKPVEKCDTWFSVSSFASEY